MKKNTTSVSKSSTQKSAGHKEHTRDSAASALPGKFDRPINLTFLGAGSMFTPRLVNDLISTPGHKGGEIRLVDIDRDRLSRVKNLIARLLRERGQEKQWKIRATTDRRKVLKGSDYMVCCIEVTGLSCVGFDNEIPARYGVDQCIGDTIGPGGLFKGLRTIPVFLDILRDAEDLCPNAILLNYTNPMGMMCLAAFRQSSIPVVGLCHSVQGTSQLLAEEAGIPYSELQWCCAGINHLAWFTRLEKAGKNLYPQLFRKWKPEVDGKFRDKNIERDKDIVRKDMALNFGAFITESSGHLSEYLPYYRKRESLINHYMRPKYDGESSFYANNWPEWRKSADEERDQMIQGKKAMSWNRSWEYASWIIEAREKNVPWRFHGNVYNTDKVGGTLIGNLPADGCVEVACLVDGNGIQPTRFGNLPPHMAAICSSNMSMIDLGARAATEKSIELAAYALMLDPLTAAVCSPSEIKQMTVDLFKAEKAYLPGYR